MITLCKLTAHQRLAGAFHSRRVVDGSSNSAISQPRMRDILPWTSFRECFSALEMDGVALQYSTLKAIASTPDDSALRIDNMEDFIHETIDHREKRHL